MPIYGILILQSIRCSPTLWAVTQPSQFRSIMDKDEFVREPQISLYFYKICYLPLLPVFDVFDVCSVDYCEELFL